MINPTHPLYPLDDSTKIYLVIDLSIISYSPYALIKYYTRFIELES